MITVYYYKTTKKRAKETIKEQATPQDKERLKIMAGPGVNPVQGFRTCRDLHWEFLRLWTGFELPSSWTALPCYGPDLNRNILDFMRWPHIGLRAQDLNDIQRPKSFQNNSWK
jgi:hypothetical protein